MTDHETHRLGTEAIREQGRKARARGDSNENPYNSLYQPAAHREWNEGYYGKGHHNGT